MFYSSWVQGQTSWLREPSYFEEVAMTTITRAIQYISEYPKETVAVVGVAGAAIILNSRMAAAALCGGAVIALHHALCRT